MILPSWEEITKITNYDVLLFEGPDKVGKTEIAKDFAKKFGYLYFKHHREVEYFQQGTFKDAMIFEHRYFTAFLKNAKPRIIIDRSYVSEYAYSMALKRDFNLENLIKIDALYKDIPAINVFIYRDEPFEEDELVRREDYHKVIYFYEKFFQEITKCDYIKFEHKGEIR